MSEMSDAGGHDQVEGRNPVLEALQGPRDVKTIYLARGARRAGVIGEILSLAGRAGIRVVEINREEIEKMSKTRAHQGIVAEVSPYRYASMQELLQLIDGKSFPLILALDRVEDPQNFGSLLRVADGAGVDGVVIARRRSSPVTAVVAKASAGAIEHMRVFQVPNISSTLTRLKEQGLWVVGADAGGSDLYHEIDFTLPTVVVLGSEGKGLSRLVRDRCDRLVRLPMAGSVSSLNVATAGAVLLYEAGRQRSLRSVPGT